MTVTARKYALQSGITPRPGQMVGLYAMELAVLLSWTVLLDTILRLLSGSWLALLPVSYLFAVTLLAWLERPGSRRRENNPLEGLGLAEVRFDGGKPSEWQTLGRLAVTPPLLLLLCMGLAPVPGTGRNLIQLISGTKIVPLDESMDPRPDEEIFRSRKRALMKVIAYTMVSFMVAAVITFVPPELSGGRVEGRITAVHSLPERERQLLADYLEMKAMYPDCLAFRVRLASLYYRNDMTEDLLIELAYIRRRDPDHAILLLEQDLTVDMEDLLTAGDTTSTDSLEFLAVAVDTPLQPDSTAPDSQIAPEGPGIQDTAAVIVDTVATPADTGTGSQFPVLEDTTAVIPESTETAPDTTPAEETSPAGSLSTQETEDVQAVETGDETSGSEIISPEVTAPEVPEETSEVLPEDSGQVTSSETETTPEPDVVEEQPQPEGP